MVETASKKTKVCPDCTTKNRLSANFCAACGCLLDEDTYTGQISTYRIVEKQPFAYGRVSVLLKASNSNGEFVAIKAFRSLPTTHNQNANKDVVDEFDQQIFAQYSQLKHANILSVLDYGNKEETHGNTYPFLVLPFCAGGNLKQVIQSKSFIDFETCLPILEQIALAIDHAHKNGFIHGDIKPENILFPEKDLLSVRLTDFGLAKYFPPLEQMTTVNARGGSLIYLSPEQVEKNKQSPASDIFSFAIVTYEMLTGCLPYDLSLSPYALLHAKVKGDVVDPQIHNEKISQTVQKALLKGLSVDPRKRPKTAIEFCQMLKEQNPIDLPKNQGKGFWGNLSPFEKFSVVIGALTLVIGVLTILATILATVIAAIIGIIPNFLK